MTIQYNIDGGTKKWTRNALRRFFGPKRSEYDFSDYMPLESTEADEGLAIIMYAFEKVEDMNPYGIGAVQEFYAQFRKEEDSHINLSSICDITPRVGF